MNAKEITAIACHALDDKKGQHITVLNIGAISILTDYFILVSAGSISQVQALTNHVEEKLGEQGLHCRAMEGGQTNRWVLMDYGDVIIHVFHQEDRHFYDLERIWRDAPDVTVQFLSNLKE